MEPIRPSSTAWICNRLLPGEFPRFCGTTNRLASVSCSGCQTNRDIYCQVYRNNEMVGTFCSAYRVLYHKAEDDEDRRVAALLGIDSGSGSGAGNKDKEKDKDKDNDKGKEAEVK